MYRRRKKKIKRIIKKSIPSYYKNCDQILQETMLNLSIEERIEWCISYSELFKEITNYKHNDGDNFVLRLPNQNS